MTERLNQAIEAARRLPPEEQDEIARLIMDVVHGASADVYVLSDEERAAIQEGIDQADRGDFASEEEVKALLARYR